MRQIYFIAIAVVGVLIAVVPTETMVTYGQNDGQSNDPKNQACYNAGFGDGKQNHAYSQSMFNQCGINGKAYYQGFLSGCISGQGKDYFSCQRLTNAPVGGGSSGNSGSDGSSGNSGSDGNSNSGSDGNSNSGSN
jgi:hypothetical protein